MRIRQRFAQLQLVRSLECLVTPYTCQYQHRVGSRQGSAGLLQRHHFVSPDPKPRRSILRCRNLIVDHRQSRKHRKGNQNPHYLSHKQEQLCPSYPLLVPRFCRE